jgi:hypothetical protein
MSEPPVIDDAAGRRLAEVTDELGDASPGERAELLAVADRLNHRALPRPAYRAALRAALLGQGSTRPERLRRLVLVYASTGAALLAFATVGVAGIGPLAA